MLLWIIPPTPSPTTTLNGRADARGASHGAGLPLAAPTSLGQPNPGCPSLVVWREIARRPLAEDRLRRCPAKASKKHSLGNAVSSGAVAGGPVTAPPRVHRRSDGTGEGAGPRRGPARWPGRRPRASRVPCSRAALFWIMKSRICGGMEIPRSVPCSGLRCVCDVRFRCDPKNGRCSPLFSPFGVGRVRSSRMRKV